MQLKGGKVLTKELLEGYRSKKAEIRELTLKKYGIATDESMIDNDVIFDYKTGYPIPQAVVGVDQNKIERTRQRYAKRIEQLEKDCKQVEEFVEGIPDSLIRRIFRMYYVEGRSQKAVAAAVHMERSNISKKIEAFLKVSHNSHNSHL